MLVTLAFCQREIPLVQKLAGWIKELGGVDNHELLLAPAWSVFMTGEHKPVIELFEKSFSTVKVMQPPGEDEYGWPDSANFAWRAVVSHVVNGLGGVPFFWMEADAVPLCPDWLDRIEAEWKASGKPFLGARVALPDIPVHMTGIAVYSEIAKHIPKNQVIQYQFSYRKPQVAFDVQHREQTLPNAKLTALIQHEWKPEPFADDASLSRLNPETVIYHQCKDGSLIDRLREKGTNPVAVSNCAEEITSPKDTPHFDSITKPRLTTPFADTVFTFFRPVDQIDKREQEALIDLWMFSWRARGWNPVMIDRIDTRNPGLIKAFSELPTINPGAYDFNCFARWLAVAEMGGGFLCDYDVMNNGLKPFPVPKRLTVYQTENACPSFVGGTVDEFLRIARLFATRGKEFVIQENGHGPHVSDMHILQGLPEEYDQKSIVKPYGGRGWGMARAVHFANQTMNGKKPRSKWIPHLMYQRAPR